MVPNGAMSGDPSLLLSPALRGTPWEPLGGSRVGLSKAFRPWQGAGIYPTCAGKLLEGSEQVP